MNRFPRLRERLADATGPASDVLAEVLGDAPHGALVLDRTRQVVYVNAAFTALTGWTLPDLRARGWRGLVGPDTSSHAVDSLGEALAAGSAFHEQLLVYRPDGSTLWDEVAAEPLRVGARGRTHFVSLHRDLSRQMAVQTQLESLAWRDPLTGLPNRFALEQHLAERPPTIREGERYVAVGIIDVDDQTRLEDQHGHQAGDAVLTELAVRIQTRLGDGDLVARYSPHEFVVVLTVDEGDVRDEVEALVARLHRVVERPVVLPGGTETPLAIRMGLAVTRHGDLTGDHLLREAAAALEQVKDQPAHLDAWWQLTLPGPLPAGLLAGLVRVNHAKPQPDDDGPLLMSAEAFRDLLARGGLAMHVQPIVNIVTGRIELVEALARMRLDDGTIVPPHRFLPLLEEHDVDALFRAGVEQALDLLVAWDARGHHMRISVNLPPVSLDDPGCADWVRDALATRNIAPDRLGLELLETEIVDTPAQVAAFRQLAAVGVKLVMDDFGAGYSSMARLAHLEFTVLKVDRQLLANLRISPIETLSLLAGLLQLAEDLQTYVSVEGLEHLDVTEAVMSLGATYVQGFFLARPMPPHELEGWMETFELPVRPGRVHTMLGALAHHWQHARDGHPHPGPLDDCPAIDVLRGEDTAAWHAALHHPDPEPGTAEKLSAWLVDRVRAERPR